MAEYSSKDLAQRFGVTNETIRSWSIEFKAYLSSGANPGDNRHRRFTFEDLEVLTLVAEMRASHHTFEDIHASLATGERGVPAIDPAALMPLESQQQLALLHDTINSLRAQISDLEAMRIAEKTRADRAEGSLAYSERLFKEQLADKEKLIRELYLEIAQLQARQSTNANGGKGENKE